MRFPGFSARGFTLRLPMREVHLNGERAAFLSAFNSRQGNLSVPVTRSLNIYSLGFSRWQSSESSERKTETRQFSRISLHHVNGGEMADVARSDDLDNNLRSVSADKKSVHPSEKVGLTSLAFL